MKHILKIAALLVASLFVFTSCDEDFFSNSKKVTLEKTWRVVDDGSMDFFIVIKDGTFKKGYGGQYIAEHHGLTGYDNYIILELCATYVIEPDPDTKTSGKIIIHVEGHALELNYSELTANRVKLTFPPEVEVPFEVPDELLLEAWTTKMTVVTEAEFYNLIGQSVDPQKVTLEKTWKIIGEVPKSDPTSEPNVFIILKDNVCKIGLDGNYIAKQHGRTGFDNYIVVQMYGKYTIKPATKTMGKLTLIIDEGVIEIDYSELTEENVKLTFPPESEGQAPPTILLEACTEEMIVMSENEFYELIGR